ncbi:MAG: hypothetical protein V1874_02230 [Spirochaetota bacterium]
MQQDQHSLSGCRSAQANARSKQRMISKFRNAFGKMRSLRNPRSQQKTWKQHGRAGSTGYLNW